MGWGAEICWKCQGKLIVGFCIRCAADKAMERWTPEKREEIERMSRRIDSAPPLGGPVPDVLPEKL